MAFVYDLNNITITAAHFYFVFKEKLKENGWNVVASGDGNGAFSSTGDVLTTWHSSGGSVANSINNADAWFRIQAPDGGREFVFQRDTFNPTNDADLAGVWYSASAGFTGGSPSTNTRSTATDEARISTGEFVNRGTGNATGSRRNIADFIFGDADEDYAFFALSRLFGNFAIYAGGMFMDVLEETFDPNDEDPVVICVAGDSDIFSGAIFDGRDAFTPNSGGGAAFAWRKSVNKNEETSMSRHFLIQLTTSSDRSDRILSQPNPYDGKIDVIAPAIWAQSTDNLAVAYIKGTSKFFGYIGGGTNLDMTQDLKWFRINNFMGLRWDGITFPVI